MDRVKIPVDLMDHFPSVEEIKDSWACITCHHPPKYSVLTCKKGHLVCSGHSESSPTAWATCTAVVQYAGTEEERFCGHSFVQREMKWYKYLCDNVQIQCTDGGTGYSEVIVGMKAAEKIILRGRKDGEERQYRKLAHEVDCRRLWEIPVPDILTPSRQEVMGAEIEGDPNRGKDSAEEILGLIQD